MEYYIDYCKFGRKGCFSNFAHPTGGLNKNWNERTNAFQLYKIGVQTQSYTIHTRTTWVINRFKGFFTKFTDITDSSKLEWNSTKRAKAWKVEMSTITEMLEILEINQNSVNYTDFTGTSSFQ